MHARVVLLLAAVSSCLPAAGQVYETGFEPPTFHVGPIAGQDGWTSLSGPSAQQVIQTATVRTGIQAGAVDNTGVQGQNAVLSPELDLDITNFPGQTVVHIQEDIYIASAGPHADWTIEPIAPPFADYIAFQIQPDGKVHFITGSGPISTGVAFSYNTWNTINIDLDFSAKTVTASLNGNVLITGVPLRANSTVLKFVVQGAVLPGNEQFFFDNFSVSTSNPLFFLWFFMA